MFFKKKDKGEDKAAAPEPRRGDPRREEARREEPRRQEPPRQAPAAPAPAAQPAPARAGAGAAIDAALTKVRSAAGAPVSPEVNAAQTRAADLLASSSDPVEQAVARDLAAGNIDKGLQALQMAAQTTGPASAGRWRMLGALSFSVYAGLASFAYENLSNMPPRQFWDSIFLARLRGITRKMAPAKEAATTALSVAATDGERALAHCELGMIARASNDFAGAVTHAETAIALGARGAAATSDPGREQIVRLVLLGDAALGAGEHAKARVALAEALETARRLGQASPTDTVLARGVCEILEKVATAATVAGDHAGSGKAIDEAINIRRRLAPVLPPLDADRQLSQSLTLKGELRRLAEDMPGSRAAFDESLGLARKVSTAHPADTAAQRELWGTMWRMASLDDVGVSWGQVVSAMEKMEAAGALDVEGRKYLEEGRRRAA